MFAREQKQEYDPASVPAVERPLAKQLQGNAYGGTGLEGFRSAERAGNFGHKRSESQSSVPLYSPTRTPLKISGANALRSPSKDQLSPTKSSLSPKKFNGKSSFDSENGVWSAEDSEDEKSLPPGRILHRHAKSVTFDQAPPQINEYEMATPDVSSIGTGSRENSYDSGEEDDSELYPLEHSLEPDDSFDASLEDTDKTPVVGPEDWRHASPENYRNGIMSGRFEDPFDGPEGSPMPDARPSSAMGRPAAVRNDSLNSNGEHRPLPPLPGMSLHGRSGSASSNGLSAAAERATQRGLPSPPPAASFSKSDIQGMNAGKMTLEERLQLMMIQDDDNKPKTAAELQRERRLRRGGPRDHNSQTPEPDRERSQSIPIHEDEDTVDDLPDLGSYQLPPRISRESIMRKVHGQDALSRDSDYNFSSPMPSSSPERQTALDPDTPIPTTENSALLENDTADDSVVIKAEPEDEDDDLDVYAIPEMYQPTESQMSQYSDEHDVPAEDDAESHYSDPSVPNDNPQSHSNSGLDDDGPPTPRALTPPKEVEYQKPIKESRTSSLPEFEGFSGKNTDFGLSLASYMDQPPSPPPKDDPVSSIVKNDPPDTAPREERPAEAPSMTQAHEYLRRPETPEQRPLPTLKPEYDGSGWGPEDDEEYESGTPDSVIHNPLLEEQSPPRDSPAIPEQVATIKSSFGLKLKTRPSATPSDLQAMREMRRIVSTELPNIPAIPQRHRDRPSPAPEDMNSSAESLVERHPSFKKKSLTLDIGADIGLGLDKDFDRVIEAQKVAFTSSPSYSTYLLDENGQASGVDNLQTRGYYANLAPRKQRGYLMRQNTKLVVASSDNHSSDDHRGSRSAGNSPIKQDRPQSWTVEPWNGQARKNSKSMPRKKPAPGPVPPMPGQDSNTTGLGMVSEEPSLDVSSEEAGERGRLFVKVIGVKDLDLPLPKSMYTIRRTCETY
jgi:hypothetical protein